MSYTYAQRKKPATRADAARSAAPERMDALARGAVKPSAAEMGHRVDLPDAMRAKFEQSFGADLSAVKLYESEAVGDEGAMAARGESVYGGMSYGGAVAPLSSATAASAAGPMQAKRDKPQQAGQELRPWEISKDQFKGNQFNPTGNEEVAKYQKLIDDAKTPAEAYKQLMLMNGDKESGMVDENGQEWNPEGLDLDLFKGKLKNMARMIHDYPELAGKIGNMKKTTKRASMTAGSTVGGRQKADISYNPQKDKKGIGASIKRSFYNTWGKMIGFNISGAEYAGNHELGHVLNSLILDPTNENNAKADWAYNITANQMLEETLQNDAVMSPAKRQKLVRHQNTVPNKHLQNQIDLKKSGLGDKGITSVYGSTDAGEFFAEAFADVYAHGNKAKKASIELLKVYEKRRPELLKNSQKKET